MERGPLGLNPRASHPTVTSDARQSGHGPLSTGPEQHHRPRSALLPASSLALCDLVSHLHLGVRLRRPFGPGGRGPPLITGRPVATVKPPGCLCTTPPTGHL